MRSSTSIFVFASAAVLAAAAKAHGEGEPSGHHLKIFGRDRRQQQQEQLHGPAYGTRQATPTAGAGGGSRGLRNRMSPASELQLRPPSAPAVDVAPARRQQFSSGDLLELFPSSIRGGGGESRKLDERALREERHRVRSVLLYYPNLVGYVRIALVLASYYLAETNWKASSCFYVVAFAGDAIDGHLARKFNQASRFGAVLDMATDRCSTAGLLLVLSRLYGRRHAFAFLMLMFVDLFSHWMHTHSVAGKHHKSTATLKRRSILIRTYYDNLFFFAFCCIGTELLYVLLYLLHFLPEGSRAFAPMRKFCFWLCLPACVLKQLINVTQIFSAARTLALEELDQRDR